MSDHDQLATDREVQNFKAALRVRFYIKILTLVFFLKKIRYEGKFPCIVSEENFWKEPYLRVLLSDERLLQGGKEWETMVIDKCSGESII